MNEVPLRRIAFHFVSGLVFGVTKRTNYLGPTLEVIVMMHSKYLSPGPRQ